MKSLTPDNTHYYKKYTLRHYYNSHIMLILLNKQCKLWLKPDSTQNYSSGRRLQFSCMWYNSKYSNKLNTRLLMPGNIHYCKKYTLKHQRNWHTMLILLNKQCRLQTRPNSSQNYSSSRRLQFSCMWYNSKYSNKLNTRLLTPSNTRYCKKYKLLRFDYMCCSL